MQIICNGKTVILELLSQPIPIPTECPSCKSVLVKDGTHIFCQNEDCEGKEWRKLKTYLIKREIKFIGDELLTTLYEYYNIKQPHQLYYLTEEYLSKVPRGAGVVGTLSKQIMAELEKSKSCSLNDFIGSLGIKFLGRRQAEIMIGQGIDTLNKWLNLSVAALLELPGFTVEGSKAPAIVEGIQKAKPIIDGLLKAGVTIQAAEPTTAVVVEGGKLSGLVFCFTGAILKTDESGKRYTRDRMWEVVRQNGGTVMDDVKKGVSHLVQADPSSQSSKSRKAEKFGVKVISEADFWKLVE